MATRYWVGGSATWNTSTANWASTSGGASGASVPGTADDVIFDANSGAAAVTTGTQTNSIKSLTLASGFTGTLTLGHGITISGALTLTQGTFACNSRAVLCGSFVTSGSATRSLTFTTGTLGLTATSGTVWDVQSSTGLTWTPGTSVISWGGGGGSVTFNGGGLTYHGLFISGASANNVASTFTLTGANTFSSITFSTQFFLNATLTVVFPASTTTTGGTLNFSSAAGVNSQISLTSSSPGTQATLSGAIGTQSGANSLNVTDNIAAGTTPFVITTVVHSLSNTTNWQVVNNTGLPGEARIQTSPTSAQTAVARLQSTPTKTQAAVSRLSSLVTNTQSAISRIAKTFTKTQPAVSRVSISGTSTQSAVARIDVPEMQVQSATARVVVPTETHILPATARVVATITKTQSAHSRIQFIGQSILTAVSRLSKIGSSTQGANARIAVHAATVQTGTAHIVALGTYSNPNVVVIVRKSIPVVPIISQVPPLPVMV